MTIEHTEIKLPGNRTQVITIEIDDKLPADDQAASRKRQIEQAAAQLGGEKPA